MSEVFFLSFMRFVRAKTLNSEFVVYKTFYILNLHQK